MIMIRAFSVEDVINSSEKEGMTNDTYMYCKVLFPKLWRPWM